MNGEESNREILCNIARSAFEVVTRLLSRDQLLSHSLRTRETGSRQIYREECITVEMATELLMNFPNQVEIALFTPHEERSTGADWYWRFEKGGRAIHARVQAKRVQRAEFGQPDNEGMVQLDAPQLVQLVDATSRARMELPELQAWLATYARDDRAYPPCGQTNLANCKHHQHTGSCLPHGPSLWIANAAAIPDSFNGRSVPVRRIIEKSLRLDCLLPCIDEPTVNGDPASKGFVLQPGLESFQDCVAIIEGSDKLRSQFEGAMQIAI
jgi:hypothetical protein